MLASIGGIGKGAIAEASSDATGALDDDEEAAALEDDEDDIAGQRRRQHLSTSIECNRIHQNKTRKQTTR